MVATTDELKEAIDAFVQLLSGRVRIEAVILFGSYVNGAPDEWSDFDVAVISPDFEDMSMPERQRLISRTSLNRDSRISPFGYPSSEYHSPGPNSFLREIIKTGKVVYPAHRG